jgi:hypothetical protein
MTAVAYAMIGFLPISIVSGGIGSLGLAWNLWGDGALFSS